MEIVFCVIGFLVVLVVLAGIYWICEIGSDGY